MMNPMWAPIQRHIDRLNSGNPPALKHYTNRAGAAGILRSGHMWFSDRTILNDTTEISYGVNIAQSILRGIHPTEILAEFNRYAEDIFNKYYFFSSSYSLNVITHPLAMDSNL